MTEYTGKSDEELASWFIISTCQLHPKSFSSVSDQMHNLKFSAKPAPNEFLILCGSNAEFYIEPLNTCISDIDFFICNTGELAFSGDFPVLPSDMSGLASSIMCYKIESYKRYPGFVRLRILGDMNYNWRYKRYRFEHRPITIPNRYKVIDMVSAISGRFSRLGVVKTVPNTVSGPAITLESNYGSHLGFDYVQSVWCPQWPADAENWPRRPRNHEWPTADTISKVVQSGCHVVYVQHRSCRHDKIQWRFSFSFAEAVLLQSWTKLQQIVYHLLRFYAKRELIEKDCPKEDEVLCMYHLKTLMLWTCEEMSPDWWNSCSVIAICSELLQKLSGWLKKRYCPNYFIPEVNLFLQPSSSKRLGLTEKIWEFRNAGILSHWFVANYILPFTRMTFKVKGASEEELHFVDYILPLLELRKASESKSLDLMFFIRFDSCHDVCRTAVKNSLTSGLCQSLKDENHTRILAMRKHSRWTKFAPIERLFCLTYYGNLVFSLHTAYSLGCEEISWNSSLFIEFVEAISMQPKIVRSKFHNFPKMHETQTSQFQFLRAVDLMQNVTGSNSCSEFQLVSLMAKEFLTKALEDDSSKSNGNAPAALAYLAALHFVSSEYQQAIRLCQAVFVNQTSQQDKETLNAGCLLFIDDVVRIVGFCVLHNKATGNNLHYLNRRLYIDLRISPEVFAHYLIVSSAENISTHLDVNHNLPDSAFPLDGYLKALIKPKCIVSMKTKTHFDATRQCIYRRTGSVRVTEAEFNSSRIRQKLVHSLMEYALENMTSFYKVIHKDFSIQCNTADCYRALYLYKCRQYNEVLHLCDRILLGPDLQSDLKKFAFANVLLLPPLDSFFDGDVQSLLGFHTLFHYLSPLNDEMRKLELNTKVSFRHWFATYVYFCGNELAVSLIYNFPVKCYYFLGRHFLARYLKVRCFIDCSLPYSEALTKFAANKTYLPFEHIIRTFFLQKFRFV